MPCCGTAYYLARNHGITDVAVLDKGYLGSGGSGRATAILRSNYLTPEGVRFHDRSLELYRADVRGPHRRVGAGMDVRSQDTWPTLSFDVKAANELARRALPAGFYYKTFMSPAWLWPAYERVLERFAHGGVVARGIGPDPEYDGRGSYDKRHAHPDVIVAGGGPATRTSGCAWRLS